MPTVLELGLEQRRRYVEAARRSLAQSAATVEDPSVRAHLLDRVRRSAADLKTRFGVQRVIVFGSLAQPEWFAEFGCGYCRGRIARGRLLGCLADPGGCDP